jgi:hypothetical protein
MMVIINLERKDRQLFSFRNITEAIAACVIAHPIYLSQFIQFIRNSSQYDVDRFHKTIARIQQRIQKKRCPANSDDEYVKLLGGLSRACKKSDDVNDLRGILAEQIFFQCFNRLSLGRDWTIRMGCSVKINGEIVFCRLGDESKITVDLAAWCFNRQVGKFYEVKVSPYAFKEVDCAYLSLLYSRLANAGLTDYKIGIFSLDDPILFLERIRSQGIVLHDEIAVLSIRDFIDDSYCGIL